MPTLVQRLQISPCGLYSHYSERTLVIVYGRARIICRDRQSEQSQNVQILGYADLWLSTRRIIVGSQIVPSTEFHLVQAVVCF